MAKTVVKPPKVIKVIDIDMEEDIPVIEVIPKIIKPVTIEEIIPEDDDIDNEDLKAFLIRMPAVTVIQKQVEKVVAQQPVNNLEHSACGKVLTNVSNLNGHILGHKFREFNCSECS